MFTDFIKTGFQYLLPKNRITRLAGMLAGVKNPAIKNTLIRHFIRAYGVNMQEAMEEHPEAYADFNAFFIRHLKPGLRPLADSAIISPVDGCISEIGDIQQGQIFQAKGHEYTVSSLLACDDRMSHRFNKGRFATLYLAPKDYHRIHMPVDGRLIATTFIPGQLFSVNPLSARMIPGLFARNKRLVAFFETDCGPLAMVLVGATIVGAIGTAWQGEIAASKSIVHSDFTHASHAFVKGQEIGYFKLGSTVILLFGEREAMGFEEGLKAGIPIKLGQAFGNKSF